MSQLSLCIRTLNTFIGDIKLLEYLVSVTLSWSPSWLNLKRFWLHFLQHVYLWLDGWSLLSTTASWWGKLFSCKWISSSRNVFAKSSRTLSTVSDQNHWHFERKKKRERKRNRHQHRSSYLLNTHLHKKHKLIKINTTASATYSGIFYCVLGLKFTPIFLIWTNLLRKVDQKLNKRNGNANRLYLRWAI